VIGAGVTLPSLGFAVLPSFTGEGVSAPPVDLGPLANFPEGKFVITTFVSNEAQGDVSTRTAYIRNNGLSEAKEPSFTIIYSRCVHLGCPVQPNGPRFEDQKKTYKDPAGSTVTLTPVQPAGFGCPCHGGAYDTEGNRTAGPPVRSLDRYAFSVKNGNLILGKHFSVGTVEGTGADARISRYRQAYPGVHVDGIERWLYPIPVPGS
jgi:menaquinol-cytochrome c reductase iron-sulfur subunit